ncbi:MAG: zf-HC2 domain-containing protein [Oscillospiraceae bacterium]|jgi:hypothetical protein|nr:zf-HC2 domain-containing protein [Oscillospiraceae bacterium]
MEDCGKYIELAALLPDGELSKAEEDELMRHAAECDECAARIREYGAIHNAMREDFAKPPDTLVPGVMYKLGLPEYSRAARKGLRRFAPRGFTLAAACIAAIILLFAQNRENGLSRSSAETPRQDAAADFYTTADEESAASLTATGAPPPQAAPPAAGVPADVDSSSKFGLQGSDGEMLPQESDAYYSSDLPERSGFELSRNFAPQAYRYCFIANSPAPQGLSVNAADSSDGAPYINAENSEDFFVIIEGIDGELLEGSGDLYIVEFRP